MRFLGWWGAWVGGRGHRARGERASLDGRLSGEGVVLVHPLGDQGPQRRVRREDPMVAVAVDTVEGERRPGAIPD